MSLIFERRLLAIIGSSLGLGALTAAIVKQLRLERSVGEAAAVGIIVDVSPDQFQLNIRVALTLMLGAVCLWSKWTNRLAIIAAALMFLVVVPFYSASNVFDRAEPEILLAAMIILGVAVMFFRRDWSNALNTMLAGAFVLTNFAAWFMWTDRVKHGAGVTELHPNTRLNNTLYGAEPWHLIILLWALIMLAWAARLFVKELKNRNRDGAGLKL